MTIILRTNAYTQAIWQPVLNLDATLASSDYAWLLAKNEFGDVHPGYLQWAYDSGTMIWSATFTEATLDASPNAYYDLDGSTMVAPQRHDGTGTLDIALYPKGSRLTGSAIAKKIAGTNYIWTCHAVGVNHYNTSVGADRSACQWLKLRVNGTYLSLSDQGRVFDGATTNPYFYYNPSLAVDDSGNMVMAFASGRGGEYISTMFVGKLISSASTDPVLIQGGSSYFNSNYWGDYTHTTFDSSDPNDLSFWTVQEFPISGYWGTTVTKLKKY